MVYQDEVQVLHLRQLFNTDQYLTNVTKHFMTSCHKLLYIINRFTKLLYFSCQLWSQLKGFSSSLRAWHTFTQWPPRKHCCGSTLLEHNSSDFFSEELSVRRTAVPTCYLAALAGADAIVVAWGLVLTHKTGLISARRGQRGGGAGEEVIWARAGALTSNCCKNTT